MEQAVSKRIKQAQYIHHQPLTRSASSKVEASSAAKITLGSHRLHHPQPAVQEAHISKPFNKSQVWDCGSSLYDSFELNSFNLHLHQAMKASSSVTRSLSMPHLVEARRPEPLPVMIVVVAKHQLSAPKKLGKQVSNSLKRVLRSVFGSSKTVNNSSKVPSPLFPKAKAREMHKDNFYAYNGSKSMRVLSTILETQETDEQSNFVEDETPEVRRAASERFTAPVVGVSFASK